MFPHVSRCYYNLFYCGGPQKYKAVQETFPPSRCTQFRGLTFYLRLSWTVYHVIQALVADPMGSVVQSTICLGVFSIACLANYPTFSDGTIWWDVWCNFDIITSVAVSRGAIVDPQQENTYVRESLHHRKFEMHSFRSIILYLAPVLERCCVYSHQTSGVALLCSTRQL